MRFFFRSLSLVVAATAMLFAVAPTLALSLRDQALINVMREVNPQKAEEIETTLNEIDNSKMSEKEKLEAKVKFLSKENDEAERDVDLAQRFGNPEGQKQSETVWGLTLGLEGAARDRLSRAKNVATFHSVPLTPELEKRIHAEILRLEAEEKKKSGPPGPSSVEPKKVTFAPGGGPVQDFAVSFTVGAGRWNGTAGGIGGVENTLTLERRNGVLSGDDDDGSFARYVAGIEVLMPGNTDPLSQLAGMSGVINHLTFRAEVADADLHRRGTYDPDGDTFYFQGLGSNIADTVSLPATFDATTRDNFVDEFTHRGSVERRSLALGLVSHARLPDCEDTTVGTRVSFIYEWTDQHNTFDARIDDYFPLDAPGFNVRATYDELIDSHTIALALGGNARWGFAQDFYLAANVAGRVGYSEAEAALGRRLDINGSLSTLSAEIDESEVTLGARGRLALGYEFEGGAVELGLATAWANDFWVVDYAPGVPAKLRADDRFEVVGEAALKLRF